MNIYDYYIEKNKDINWRNTYQSTSNDKKGKTFIYINTNFRTMLSFTNIFEKFYCYNGLDRSLWKLNDNHGQEEAKQWVVNMTHSKLFKKQNSKYNLTEKGLAFKEFINSNFKDNSKWLLIFLFLSNSYFGYIPNYVVNKCQDIMSVFNKNGFDKNYILNNIQEILAKKDVSILDLMNNDIFWLITFYQDTDFLMLYKQAKKEDKELLHKYCINNYKNHSYNDCISYKYKPSGQYTKSTFIDDLKVIYFSIKIYDYNISDFYLYIDKLMQIYAEIYTFDSDKVKEFIENHSDVFEVIFKDIRGLTEEDIVNDYTYIKNENNSLSEEKIDDTTSKNLDNIRKVSAVLKRIAKERNDYKCELEELHSCKYFTSKDSNKNYLEIHHLIPREFSNEFEKSIEIIDNYISLCPHCHRLIHLATDRERKPAINYLFNKRRECLEQKGISLGIKDLNQFYHIAE